ncbi:CAAX protease family protein [Lentilactobacillus curieae]|uniref:CAAX protease family protein n=1 Tax=Lentilactobacillus curieae TaxID=1138822 RepID=A0A1S6QJY5_9LACO|nr:type II CAAX endopeptidase family protein [Lentilactobacillus curieae]AQW21906.1 CAAX protease family protein [Lentilactobacillus curieae]
MNSNEHKLQAGDYFERIGIFILLVVLVLFVQIPLGLIAKAPKVDALAIGTGIVYLVLFIGFIGLAYYFYQRYGQVKLKSLRWNDVKLILLGFVVMMVIEIGLGILNQKVYGVQQTSNNQLVGELLGSNKLSLILLSISSVFLSPILEELVFRGFVISAFFKQSARVLPVIVSAVLFAIPHMEDTNVISFLTYASMGAVLAYVYNSTKNIKVSIGLHFLNNLYAMAGMLFLMFGNH